jgi:hypothetical protein
MNSQSNSLSCEEQSSKETWEKKRKKILFQIFSKNNINLKNHITES